MDVADHPVTTLEDTPETRTALVMIRHGLEIPSEAFVRAMALELLRVWGDPLWSTY